MFARAAVLRVVFARTRLPRHHRSCDHLARPHSPPRPGHYRPFALAAVAGGGGAGASSSAASASSVAMEPPVAMKEVTKVRFGRVEGENRGPELSLLLDPPVEIDDPYFWLRDDERKVRALCLVVFRACVRGWSARVDDTERPAET